MNCSIQTEIAQPLDEVIALSDNPSNTRHWQPGFIDMDHISVEPWEQGARSRLTYRMGRREIDMIETISTWDLPREFYGTYDAYGVHNIVQNFFEAVDENTTLWKSFNTFRFTGFMKVIAFLMPGSFKKTVGEVPAAIQGICRVHETVPRHRTD